MTSNNDNNDDDLYSERERAEIDELNRLDETAPSFLQSRWWRRLAVGFAVVVVAALLIPIVAITMSGGSSGDEPSAAPPPAAYPDFELANAHGGAVRLSDAAARNDAVVIVFYRGFF